MDSSDLPGLLYQREGCIARVTFNRPEALNCFSIEGYCALADAVLRANLDPEVQLIVLTGSGRAFSTGGDLAQIRRAMADGTTEETTARFADASLRAFRAIEASPKLVISLVNGICQAGGLSVVLCSDLSIAADNARFCVPEGLVGLADPYVGGRLAAKIGMTEAKWMMFTADTIDAARAGALGLVNQVVPAQELAAAGDALVSKVLKTAPTSRKYYKRSANSALPAFDTQIILDANASPDAHEGISAFIERRAPKW